jgi:hypothetical protein
MRTTYTLLATAMCLLALSCSREKSGSGPAEVVKSGLKGISYREGSRITFLTTQVQPGTCVGLDAASGDAPRVESVGYLVFIDEQPDYDWSHAAQMVFVPASHPADAVVLHAGEMIPSFKVVDEQGHTMTGVWEQLR